MKPVPPSPPPSRAELREFAERFEIGDLDALTHDLAISYNAYWANRAMSRDVPTTLGLMADYERIAAELKSVINLIEAANPMVRDALARSQLIPSARTRSGPDVHFALAKPTFVAGRIDLPTVLADLCAVKATAEHAAKHYRRQYKAGQRKHPVPEMDRRVLITNARQFWEQKLGRSFSRLFDDYDEATDRDTTVPKNECTKFVVAWAQLVDPDLTPAVIDKAMKDNIKHLRGKDK